MQGKESQAHRLHVDTLVQCLSDMPPAGYGCCRTAVTSTTCGCSPPLCTPRCLPPKLVSHALHHWMHTGACKVPAVAAQAANSRLLSWGVCCHACRAWHGGIYGLTHTLHCPQSHPVCWAPTQGRTHNQTQSVATTQTLVTQISLHTYMRGHNGVVV